jgi:hypothetical protein
MDEIGLTLEVQQQLGDGVEPPSRLLLTHWPGDKNLKEWEVPEGSLRRPRIILRRLGQSLVGRSPAPVPPTGPSEYQGTSH